MRWWVFVHVVAAFAFAIAHGGTVAVALKLRGERDRARIHALLDLSAQWMTVTYVSLLVLLVAGIVAGFLGDHWGSGWIWTAIGVLVVLIALMGGLGTRYFDQVRTAVGAKIVYAKKGKEQDPPGTDEELDRLLSSSRSIVLVAIGSIGLLLLLWLMMFRPF